LEKFGREKEVEPMNLLNSFSFELPTKIEYGVGAAKAVQKLASDVHLPGFNSLGVQENDLEELAVNSFKNGSNIDNPRPMTKEDYLNLFRVLSG
jgi:alcohol dehydrogenase